MSTHFTDSPNDDLAPVLITDRLLERDRRPPDYLAEARALTAIVTALAQSPSSILHRLVEVVLEFCAADSAGISILREGGSGEAEFYWPALAGEWSRFVGGTTPRHASPCGVVIDRDAPQLVYRPERQYAWLVGVDPSIVECLLAPFHVDGRGVGTVWVVSHGTAHTFDTEDVRRLQSLARCAASAYQVATSLDKVAATTSAVTSLNRDLSRLHGQLTTPDGTLSRREHEIVTLVAQGHTNKTIAERLGLSVKTIETYRARAIEKLGLRNRADLVSYAVAQGWLEGT